jgi:hypothetical protein
MNDEYFPFEISNSSLSNSFHFIIKNVLIQKSIIFNDSLYDKPFQSSQILIIFNKNSSYANKSLFEFLSHKETKIYLAYILDTKEKMKHNRL